MEPIRIDENIMLRQAVLEDAEVIFQAIDRNRAYLSRWMHWTVDMNSVDDGRTYVQSVIDQLEQGDGYQLIILDQSRMIGKVGLHNHMTRYHTIHINYWLDSEYQHRGIINRAMRELINLTFSEMNINRIVLEANIENTPSRSVATRLGFTLECIAKQADVIHDQYFDLAIYAMLKEEWDAIQEQDAD